MTEDEWEAPEAYDSLVGRWSARIAPAFVEWSGARGSVLDVGSGTGAVGRCVGGRVLAVDLVRKYLRAGRLAAVMGDASRLPLRDACVEAVLSGLALPQVDDPVATLGEWARVVRPGGVIAAYAWEEVPWLRAFWEAAGESRSKTPPRVGLASWFQAARLLEVESRHFEFEVGFADFAEYWAPLTTGEGPAPEHLAALPLREQEALRERLRRAVGPRPSFTASILAAKAFTLGRA